MAARSVDDETPLAWTAILEGTHVYSSDDEDLGEVYEVLGAEDIFHGVVLRGHDHFVVVPAEDIATITDQRIRLTISAQQVGSLEPYTSPGSFKLAVSGLFGRSLAWVPDQNSHS